MHILDYYMDFTGKIISTGDKRYFVEKQLNEVINPQLAQCHVLTLAYDMETSNPVMIKIRYDLNPEPFDIHDPSSHKEITDEDFLDEVKCIWYLSLLGHGPRYIKYVTASASAEFPYPEGRVFFLVTDRVPGENVDEIRGELSDAQVESIGVQLGYILDRALGQMNILLYDQDPNCLRYDMQNGKLYFIDLSYMCFGHPKDANSKKTDHVQYLAGWTSEDNRVLWVRRYPGMGC
ncbi:uncharacterized protein ACHE_40708S [Aspergillus chevalieri]|uniref:Protein kinase domain-containing protein n=1 Tax=Aspergillus chevalieri TaxID=182096 RepID=A0A7R7ZNY4_ASPCH|nr:uncharacterized protein ACHE_40708S [Aspergillus chevalieri]BCR88144.1 hypothetical protein ACHE_40708S [Aspergillus chevalieri]